MVKVTPISGDGTFGTVSESRWGQAEDVVHVIVLAPFPGRQKSYLQVIGL